MATIRRHLELSAPPDRVWAVIGDPGAVWRWFPGIARSFMAADGLRVCELTGGGLVEEEILANDSDLMRLQYRIRSGMPVTRHLGTVDVIADAKGGGSLVVYSTDVEPDDLGRPLRAAIDRAFETLRQSLE